MNIIKSNGLKQQFLPNKILKRLKDQSKDLRVDYNQVFKDCMAGVVDGMTTKEVDNLLAITAANMIIQDPDYSFLAARIILTRQGKIIGVDPVDSDYLFDFVGITSFLHKYSLRNDKGEPIELPHMMYKRVAIHLCETDWKKYYDYLRWQKISLATPILMNAGSDRRNSMISCNLATLESDSTNGILSTLDDASKASRDGAGIGLHLHSLRSSESLVKSFNGTAGGVVRFADMLQSHMRFFKQGNRSGSAAIYLGIWHRDIENFLELRLPVGDEKMRTRDLFTACCIPDLFMEKLNSGDDDWWLFCPNEVELAGFPALHETWGEGFNLLYDKLVKAGLGRKVSVRGIWNMITKSLIESGLPYINYWDNMNKRNPQSNIGIRTGANLCIEYYGVTKPGYTSQCCLGLIPLNKLEKNDFKSLREYTKALVVLLNRVIDKNAWSNNASRLAGNHQRSIGIGIAGLSDYLQNHNIPYSSQESRDFNHNVMEVIYKSAKRESSRLAVSYYGESYPAWEGSDYQKDGVPMANSLLVCLMPSASTSVLLGCTESFEAPHSNIFVRKLDVGEFTITNKYLVRDLKELGLWTKDIQDQIISSGGSIQGIQEIPQEIKEVYKTIWEISMRDYIDLAALRQENIDQGQSMNLYFNDPSTGKVSGALNHAWKLGLPTGSYYTKTRSALSAPSRLAVEKSTKTSNEVAPGFVIDCFGCSA